MQKQNLFILCINGFDLINFSPFFLDSFFNSSIRYKISLYVSLFFPRLSPLPRFPFSRYHLQPRRGGDTQCPFPRVHCRCTSCTATDATYYYCDSGNNAGSAQGVEGLRGGCIGILSRRYHLLVALPWESTGFISNSISTVPRVIKRILISSRFSRSYILIFLIFFDRR